MPGHGSTFTVVVRADDNPRDKAQVCSVSPTQCAHMELTPRQVCESISTELDVDFVKLPLRSNAGGQLDILRENAREIKEGILAVTKKRPAISVE